MQPAEVVIDIGKEIDNWQRMMFNCRQLCKALSLEYSEPEFLNWGVGRSYLATLCGQIKGIE